MKRLRRANRQQVIRDVLLWFLLSVAVSIMGPDPLDGLPAFALVTVPRIALMGVVVLVGRPWPLAAVALLLPFGPWDFREGFATSDLTWLSPPSSGVKILPLLPVSAFVMWYAYLTGRRLARVWPALALAAVATGIGVVLVLTRGGTLALWVTMTSGLVGTYAVPYLLGLLRRRLLQQRAQARHSTAEQARLRERARIARDMHDSLGHDLALIAVRAAGLEMSPNLDPAQVKAAGELRLAAADATERLHQIIGVLRDDADTAPLVPVHEDVTALVERARASGMRITLDVTGPVPGLAHAVVQEGLTNAAKHAPGAAVTVEIGPHRVTVRNGPATGPRPALPIGGGLGLAGLRERVRLADGTLTAGPTPEGWTLTATLP
ncbi:sensor histidine kinase [Nonomuraea ceibae]|uniref:sensor histidine kinase n=1 Tax=Nonomuraea ceibae TaxID=1935170 RepID=UPI001C5E9884|nr:histidine kinase [Nonomuraea ceibae]